MENNLDNKLVTKLTDWKYEPSLTELNQDYTSTVEAQTKYIAKLNEWKDLRKVEGKERPTRRANTSSVQPAVIKKQNEWRIAPLCQPYLSTEELYTLSPRTWEDTKAARDNATILNYQYSNVINKVHFINTYVRRCVEDGTVIVKVSWERQKKTVKELVPVYQYMDAIFPEQIEQINTDIGIKDTNFNEYMNLPEDRREAVNKSLDLGRPITATLVDYVEEEVTKVVTNKPVLTVIDPRNLRIDPACGNDYEKAKYLIETFEASRADLEKTGNYVNLDKVKWDGVGTDSDYYTNTPSDFQYTDKAKKLATVKEYWGYFDIDGDGTLTCIIASWIDNVLIRMEKCPYPDELPPYVLVSYIPSTESPIGEPDAEILKDNQRILGALNRGIIDTLGKSANSQTGIMKNFLDPVNAKRFKEGSDYEYNPVSDPRIAIFQHTFPELSASAINAISLHNAETESQTGIKSFSSGISGDAYGQVAAGIRGIINAAGTREMDIIYRLSAGLERIGKKIIAMNQLFLSDEEIIRITNDEFVRIRREDLKGNFDIKVLISSVEVDNNKIQNNVFLLQTLGNSVPFEITKLILADISRLSKNPLLAKQLEEYQPEPDPVAQEMAQIELEKARLELQELQANIQEKQARARKLLAEADQADLDFVEQETGTKHARDMDKQSKQAEANQGLAITKAILDNKSSPALEAAVGYNAISKQQNNEDILG